MTITVLPSRNEYTSAASQTVFNYTFKIFASTDLNVYITASGAVADDSTDLTTSYTVTGLGDESGGTIVLTTGANSGDLVTIVSNIPSSRTTDYQNNGDFRPDTVNDDFDRVVSIVKKIEDTTNRSVVSPQSQQGPKPLTLPNPIADKLLRWNGAETGLENVDLATISPSTVFLQDLIIGKSSIASMKADLTLEIGQFIETKGYRTDNDTGGGQYLVVTGGTGADDGFRYHDLDNGLQAELIINGPIKVTQAGADPTGVIESSDALNTALDIVNNNLFANVFEVQAGTYKVNKAVVMTFAFVSGLRQDVIMNWNKSRIIPDTGYTGALFQFEADIETSVLNRNTSVIINEMHCQGKDVSTFNDFGILVRGAFNMVFNNCRMKFVDVGVSLTTVSEVTFNQINCEQCGTGIEGDGYQAFVTDLSSVVLIQPVMFLMKDFHINLKGVGIFECIGGSLVVGNDAAFVPTSVMRLDGGAFLRNVKVSGVAFEQTVQLPDSVIKILGNEDISSTNTFPPCITIENCGLLTRDGVIADPTIPYVSANTVTNLRIDHNRFPNNATTTNFINVLNTRTVEIGQNYPQENFWASVTIQDSSYNLTGYNGQFDNRNLDIETVAARRASISATSSFTRSGGGNSILSSGEMVLTVNSSQFIGGEDYVLTANIKPNGTARLSVFYDGVFVKGKDYVDTGTQFLNLFVPVDNIVSDPTKDFKFKIQLLSGTDVQIRSFDILSKHSLLIPLTSDIIPTVAPPIANLLLESDLAFATTWGWKHNGTNWIGLTV
jgi:hypothetical protein